MKTGDPSDASSSVPKDKPPTQRDASAPAPGSDAGDPPREDAATSEQDAGSKQDAAEPDAGQSAPDAGMDAPSFDKVYEVISAKCINCHGANKMLDMSTRELALSGLVGVAAQYPACGGDAGTSHVRVVAGDPSASLLMAKLENKQDCGKQMPPMALLDSAQVELIRAWIAAGAQ